MTPPMISMDLLNGQAVVKPASCLGGALFDRYRAATTAGGALFDRAIKAQIIALDGVPRLQEALGQAGFAFQVSEGLAGALRARAGATRADSLAAGARLGSVRDALQAAGLRLFPFQEEGVAWLAPRTKALLLDEMGLGKTIQALIAIPEGSPAVVICPAVVKGWWAAEARRWRPDLVPVILHGKSSFRWPGEGELVILNPAILPKGKKEQTPWAPGLNCPEGVTLIVDEAHCMKSGKTHQTERFRDLAKLVGARGGRLWGLTGTPLLNRPPELWAVLQGFGLARDAFGSWPRFLELFRARPKYFGGYDWGEGSEISPEVPGLLQRVSLRRERAAVLPELPGKTWRTVEVNGLDAATKKLCDKALATLAAQGVDLGAAVAAAVASKGGAGFTELSAARAALATAKIPGLLELVDNFEEQDEALVVFCSYRAPVDLLGKREGWVSITGDTSPEARTEIVRRFQAGQYKGLAATIRAAGVGLTLTHAHHALFVDLDWTPALNAQAEDRICRIGQDKGCIITVLQAAHELDRRVNELLAAKREIISASVDASTRAKPPAEDPGKALDAAANAPVVLEHYERSQRRRPAANDVERWAERALLALADMDQDRARVVNDMGFNKIDNEFGHSLAGQVDGGLSETQWAAATKMCRKYRGQVGSPPEENHV